MTDITNDEKINIINSHIKNVEYNKYNAQLSILEENTKSSPDASLLTNLNNQIKDYDNQLQVLNAEVAKLQPTTTN